MPQKPVDQIPGINPAADPNNWSLRTDQSRKGSGFLGALQNTRGQAMTEYSIGAIRMPDGSIVDEDHPMAFKGQPIDIPSFVPTLSSDELQQLLNQPEHTPTAPSVIQKAVAHANFRRQQGKPFFALPGEQRFDIHPQFPRMAVSSDVPLASSRQNVNPDALANLITQRKLR
jgi:hypothetical protein